MKKIILATAVAATALFSACQNNGNNKSLETNIDTLSYALGMSFSMPEENLKQGMMQIGSDSAYTDEYRQGLVDGIASANDKKKIAYNVGLQQGMMIQQREISAIEHQIFGNDSAAHLNMDLFVKALNTAAKNEGVLLTDTLGQPMQPQALNMLLRTMIQEMTVQRIETQYGEYKVKNAEFMANIATQEGIQSLGNGVYYKELVAGKGAKAAAGNSLELTYEGRLIDGTVFDKTEGSNTVKFQVGTGRAIPGFDAAMQNMPEGAEWEVYIPADQAYGEMESGEIKPYSALIFKIKAIKVIKEEKK